LKQLLTYRVDETDVKAGKSWKYLYRAVDSDGNPIEFMLGERRNKAAAEKFFRKMMRADHGRRPLSLTVDKHASYPEAFSE
jgi:transposase-like protein